MKASLNDQKRCREIYKEITDDIPGYYTNLVNDVLKGKGIEPKGKIRIRHARKLEVYDLEVMMALKAIVEENKEKLNRIAS